MLAPVTGNNASPAASKNVNRPLEPLKEAKRQRRQQPGRAHHSPIAPIAKPCWGTNKQIARNPAGKPDNGGQHDDAEHVEPGSHTSQAAAQSEHKGPA
jgi:hypothetical protein